jgi:hypothetical protein
MRRLLLSTLVLALLLVPAGTALAQDSAQAIIDKAIKAHGGADQLSKLKAVESKSQGTIEAFGGIKFTQAIQLQMPDRVKSVMDIEVGGQKQTITTVFDGKSLWINANGMNIATDDKMIEEVKEQMYAGEVGKLVGLKDKKYQLSPLGEVKVEGMDAVGILVASKGHKDISLFFDKKSGLLVKMERRALDAMSGQEFTQETILKDYHEVQGMQEAKKTLIYRDGKKFIEAEVIDFKFVDKFDDSTFAKP